MKIDISKEQVKKIKKDSKIKNSSYHVQQEIGIYSFYVSSFSEPEKKYNVFVDKRNIFHCECTGFVYKQNCGHIESVKQLFNNEEKIPL